MQGIVFDIKRFAIHDGPGTRTTVFLKGCPLSCWWCHNPESIHPQIQNYELTVKLGADNFIRNKQIGEYYLVNDLLTELLKDKLFIQEGEGGITLSGGEPLLQFDFSLALLKAIKDCDLHTCVDTTGLVGIEKLKQVQMFTDLFLYDFKLFSTQLHEQYCGTPNDIIKQNLEYLCGTQTKVVVRIPLIPDVNFNNSEETQMLVYLSQLLSTSFNEVHLLPYHKIGESKYKRFDFANKMKGIPALTKNDLKPLAEKYKAAGFKTTIH